MIEEFKTLLGIIRRYLIIILIIPLFFSFLSYYFFKVIEKNSYKNYHYDYLIDIENQNHEFYVITQNLGMISNTFSYLEVPFTLNAENQKVDLDKHVRIFYLEFYERLKKGLGEFKEEALVENVRTNGHDVYQVKKVNFFSNYNDNNKSFHLSFKSGFSDVNFYNLFITDIINEANKVFSKEIIEDVKQNINNIFDELSKISYVIDGHLQVMEIQIDKTNEDINRMASLETDNYNQSLLNSNMVQKFISLETTQKRKEELILLQQIIKKVKTQINDYIQNFTAKQINYTKDINKNLKINMFEEVNYIFHYIHYFTFIFFLILTLFIAIIYDFITKRKS